MISDRKQGLWIYGRLCEVDLQWLDCVRDDYDVGNTNNLSVYSPSMAIPIIYTDFFEFDVLAAFQKADFMLFWLYGNGKV